MSDWLQEAMLSAGAQIISDEIRKALEMMKPERTVGTAPRHNPFAEFGLQNVIESTAIAIDDNVKALPAPDEVKS